MFKEKLEEARISEAQKVSDISVVDPAIMPTGSAGADKKSAIMLSGLFGISGRCSPGLCAGKLRYIYRHD